MKSHFVRDRINSKNGHRESLPLPIAIHSLAPTMKMAPRDIRRGFGMASLLAVNCPAKPMAPEANGMVGTHLVGANAKLFSHLSARMESECSELIIKDTFNHRRAKKRLNSNLSVSNKRIKTCGGMVSQTSWRAAGTQWAPLLPLALPKLFPQ